MTLQSYPSTSEEVVAASGGGSSSASSVSASTSDVYPLPFSLGQKTIAALNNDEQALVSEIADSNFLTPNTNVVIENSSNVDVGNRTVFNRDVTIYQYIQGNNLPEIQNGAVKDEVECNKNGQIVNSGNSPSTPKSFPKNYRKLLMDRPTLLWIAGILLALISIASLIVYFSVTYNFNRSGSVAPSTGHDDDLGDGIQVIKRQEWLARDPLYVTHFTHPPKMVRILHTAGVFCTDYQMCANKILGLQGSHVAQMGMPDIAYNYLVGGDGGVYIGRGADVQSNGRNDSIDIAYVGNYLAPFDKLSDKMEGSGKKLITRLLERGKITGDYIIVAHNQTENTTSPGENVFKKIIHWPHYDSGLYFPNTTG